VGCRIPFAGRIDICRRRLIQHAAKVYEMGLSSRSLFELDSLPLGDELVGGQRAGVLFMSGGDRGRTFSGQCFRCLQPFCDPTGGPHRRKCEKRLVAGILATSRPMLLPPKGPPVRRPTSDHACASRGRSDRDWPTV